MTLRFSLLSLIGLVSWASVASAALVHPSALWLSIVVTLTAAAMVWHTLRAVLLPGAPRAAAAGWLLFAIGYLAIARGPWMGQMVGPKLLSTQALRYAQVNWRKEDPNAQQAVVQPAQLWTDVSGSLLVDGVSPTIWTNSSSFAYTFVSPTPAQAPVVNCFQLSGHWLSAWLAGWLGAAVATHCQRRRQQQAGMAA